MSAYESSRSTCIAYHAETTMAIFQDGAVLFENYLYDGRDTMANNSRGHGVRSVDV